MKPPSQNIKTIVRYAAINMILSLLIVSLEFYAGGFLDGIFYYTRRILEAPCVLILNLVQGRSKTLHATGEKTYLIVSLIIYTLSIAIIQARLLRKKRTA